MTHRALVVSSFFIIGSVLTGCVSQPPAAPTPLPTSAASQTPTATPAPAMPEARFGLDCDSLATTNTVAALVDGPIEKQDPIANYTEQSSELPRLSYIEAMGGLVCDWSNGVSMFSASGIPGQPYVGASIMILPEATDQFARFEEIYGPVGELKCNGSTSMCSFDKLVNGYWVSVELGGVLLDDATSNTAPTPVADFIDSVDVVTSALDAPDPRWLPPTGTIAIGPDCEAIIPTSEVTTALGLTAEPVVQTPHGGWSIWAGATVESGGGRCSWSTSNEEFYFGSVAWLPSGAWAAEELLPGTTQPSLVTSISLNNLEAQDTAFMRCADDDSSCIVDLIVGGNWVQATAYAGGESSLSAQDGAVALAEVIAARINA